MEQCWLPVPLKGMHLLQRWSIRSQLLALALAAIVPLAAAGVYGIVDTANEALARANRDTLRMAAATAAEIETFFRETERTLGTLAQRPLVRALDPQRCDPILREIPILFPALKFPDLNAIGIRDVAGTMVCSIVKDPAPTQVVRQSPAFQKAIRGKGFDVSTAFVSPITKRWISISAYPIKDQGEQTGGLIFLRLDLRELQDKVIGRPREGAVVGVFDREGRYLMRWPDPEKWIGTQVNNLSIIKNYAVSGSEGTERLRGGDGVDRIYAFHPVAGTGWLVASGVPEASVFAPYRARLVQGVVLGAVALLLAVGLALRMSASIARPIRDLVETARKIAGGEVDARAPTGGPPELAAVGLELNRMLDARNAAESELWESRARYQGIVDSAEDAIVSKKLDGTILSWNPGAARLFGYEADEIVGRNVLQIIPPDRQNEETLIIERLLRGERVKNFESRRLRKDGTQIDVSLTISPIRDEAGRIIGASKIARDITPRIEAERLMKRKSDFYTALSATNQAIVRMHEPEELYAEICRICVENGGATMAFIALVEDGHAVPKAWSGLIDGYLPGILIPLSYDTPEAQGPIATSLRTGRPYICNDIYADPKTAPWRERASRIGSLGTAALPFRRGNEIVGVLSLHVQERGFFIPALVELLEEMATDLSFGLDNFDREQAQAEAMRQEQLASKRFRAIFDASPLATCIVRVSDARIVAVNPAYCTRFERSSGELLGRTALELDIWADPADRQRMIERLGSEQHVREFPTQVRTGTGRLLDTLVNVERVEFLDEPCMMIQNMDITEMKQAEVMLRNMNVMLERRVAERTAELEAANRELDSFGRTIAHDLRAPLRSISRFNEALRRSLTEDAASLSHFERIAKNVTRMDQMLTDLLDFARSGRAAIAESPLDMRALAATVAEDLCGDASRRPEFACADLPEAKGDPALLRQVWANLISNAVKYSSKTAQPRIEIGARKGKDEVEYYVRDNGCGFDPAYSDKLFEVFQRLHSESEYEGNGIGLAIVHRIVERHGGRVSASSKPGEGAEFRFTLPVRNNA